MFTLRHTIYIILLCHYVVMTFMSLVHNTATWNPFVKLIAYKRQTENVIWPLTNSRRENVTHNWPCSTTNTQSWAETEHIKLQVYLPQKKSDQKVVCMVFCILIKTLNFRGTICGSNIDLHKEPILVWSIVKDPERDYSLDATCNKSIYKLITF